MTQNSAPDSAVALAALRAMVTIADSSVEHATGQLTLTQFRALRVTADRTPVTMGRVADELTMNPSTVTRACDRLVSLGLLQKAQNPLNKREILLAPTAKGRQLVDRVDEERRRVLDLVLSRLEPEQRSAMVVALGLFTDAAAGFETVAPSK
ncbi:MarR family transcriptional regulator [Amycolatopsis sp. NPDC051373]|uniref:MarR family winged helix-turn-helix transcriptional regulator n=1 Tax=Amycolatopsis sp. NPDC051373 TaxID=3155801 RepID=UPI00345092C9